MPPWGHKLCKSLWQLLNIAFSVLSIFSRFTPPWGHNFFFFAICFLLEKRPSSSIDNKKPALGGSG